MASQEKSHFSATSPNQLFVTSLESINPAFFTAVPRAEATQYLTKENSDWLPKEAF
jgi:hypothetical protein